MQTSELVVLMVCCGAGNHGASQKSGSNKLTKTSNDLRFFISKTSGLMLLFLRLQDGRTEELKVPSSDAVSSLTQHALSAFSLPASSVLSFVYKGRPLPSQGSLSDAGLTSECTIIVTVASPSGTAAAASEAVPTYPLRHFLAAALAHGACAQGAGCAHPTVSPACF